MMDIENNHSEFYTGRGTGLRYNEGKLRYDLIEPHAHRDFVQVLTDGANKYKPRNWNLGLSWTSVIASLKRHIAAIEMGEDYDPESGCLHIAHAACNAHFLNAFYYIFPQGDDRPKQFLKLPKIGLDLDGVLVDFTKGWHKLYPEISATPNSWAFDRRVKNRFDEMKNNNVLDDFYLNLEALITPNDLPFEPHCYITSRPVPQEISEQWLDDHNFPAREVINIELRGSKVDAAKNAGVEIFVDDSFDNFAELNNAGITCYLFTAPWNVRYDVGHLRLNSLEDLKILK